MSFAPSVMSFFASVIVGLLLGAVWECFRLIRKKIGDFKNFVFVLDVIYFILVSVFTVCFFFFFTSGGFRAFAVAGEFLGFMLFYSIFEKPVFPLLNLVVSILFKSTYFIYRILKACFLALTTFSEKVLLGTSARLSQIKQTQKLKSTKTSFFKTMNLKLRKNKNGKQGKKK